MSDEIGLTKAQLDMLAEPLDRSLIKTRRGGGGGMVPYMKGEDVMAQADRIFGRGKWGYDIVKSESFEVAGKIVMRAEVRVHVKGIYSRTDVGTSIAQHGRSTGDTTPEALETAIKGAVTDGIKRAFRSFGAQFGLGLVIDDDFWDDYKPPKKEKKRGKNKSSGSGGSVRIG